MEVLVEVAQETHIALQVLHPYLVALVGVLRLIVWVMVALQQEWLCLLLVVMVEHGRLLVGQLYILILKQDTYMVVAVVAGLYIILIL